MDNFNRKLTLHLIGSNGVTKSEVRLLNDEEVFKFFPRADLARSNLQAKLDWLKLKGVTLPSSRSKEELEAISTLLHRYSDILGTDDEEQGTFIKAVRIPTNGQSKCITANHVPQALETEVDSEMDRMFNLGIIEECKDPKGFNSPVFAVRKSNGKVRVVANFKDTLNRCLKDLDPYPMPTIDSLFNQIGNGNKYFASLDLKSGYWQIPIQEDERYKTAFTWSLPDPKCQRIRQTWCL